MSCPLSLFSLHRGPTSLSRHIGMVGVSCQFEICNKITFLYRLLSILEPFLYLKVVLFTVVYIPFRDAVRLVIDQWHQMLSICLWNYSSPLPTQYCLRRGNDHLQCPVCNFWKSTIISKSINKNTDTTATSLICCHYTMADEMERNVRVLF